MEWNDRKKSQVINVTFDPDRYRAVLWCAWFAGPEWQTSSSSSSLPPPPSSKSEDFRENDSPNFRLYDLSFFLRITARLPQTHTYTQNAPRLINLLISINHRGISRPFARARICSSGRGPVCAGEEEKSRQNAAVPYNQIRTKISNFEP